MSVPVNRIDENLIAAKEFVDARTVRVRVAEGTDPNQSVEILQKLFDDLFRDGVTRVFFDMRNVEFPNAPLIAMLVQRTAEARRMKGDVHLLNLSVASKNNLSIFSPLTYLSISDDAEAEGAEVSDVAEVPETGGEEPYALEEGIPYKLTVTATLDALNQLTDFATSLARSAGFEKIELSRLKMAIYEAGINVIEHGYAFERDESMGIEVLKEGDRFMVTITDKGKSFDFYDNPLYDAEEAYHEKRQGGFGRYIIERSVDEVYYQSGEDGNRLTLVKYLNKN
jgi:anti-sigma regulatory factor (Ser/Thr protein kinase)